MKPAIRLGCWAAFWGDTDRAIGQLLSVPDIDYLVSDYLAEITMALLARSRSKDPAAGYVADAVAALQPTLAEISRRGIKVVTNAGGLNPAACAKALRAAVAAAGLTLKVAAVEGDDLTACAEEILSKGAKDMFTGVEPPRRIASLNAYIGARAISSALDAGAHIVVTGRCVDAAVVLGPLMHEFGWKDTDYDLLSGGSLAGHIIECGPQCTGGTHTDWDAVPGWENLGYPIATVHADGTCVISKPPGSGGLISPATVGEQMLYEIGDPGAYLMPDVVCDWRDVRLEQTDVGQVRLSGAKGSAPTTTYKATCVAANGYRTIATATFYGLDAGGRARRCAEAVVTRTSNFAQEAGLQPLRHISIEVVGTGDMVGNRRRDESEEVVVKIGLRHDKREVLEIFAREFVPMALVAQGMTGLFAGRPGIAPVFEVYHLLVDKAAVPLSIDFGDSKQSVEIFAGSTTALTATAELPDSDTRVRGETRQVPLRRIAWARSGDKGDKANIGVMARRPEFFDVIKSQVSTSRVARHFSHVVSGSVRRWELSGSNSLNFLLDAALGGVGGTSSLRFDPQGKSFAATLLSLPVEVPAEWERKGWLAPLSGVRE